MNKNDIDNSIDQMCKALAICDDVELIKGFIESVLTDNEYNEVSSRWALVKLIDDGISQRKISDMLGLSLCKITRGSKELKKENSSFKRMIDIFRNI